jgi:hypothetical protein
MHFESAAVSRGNLSIGMHLRLAESSGVRTLAQATMLPLGGFGA